MQIFKTLAKLFYNNYNCYKYTCLTKVLTFKLITYNYFSVEKTQKEIKSVNLSLLREFQFILYNLKLKEKRKNVKQRKEHTQLELKRTQEVDKVAPFGTYSRVMRIKTF